MTTDVQRGTSLTQLTREEPKVDQNEPWGDDKLKRRNAAEALSKLIKAQRGSFVVSLDGDWGTGKTFFLERWKQQMENDNVRVVYFNAWRDDFFGDPLVPILAEIMRTTKESELKEKVSNYVKRFASANVRSLSSKHLGLELPEFEGDVMKEYECQAETRDKLRNALTDLVRNSSPKFPLVFIVDELDRCRPDFAIATLERTKHILDIPGLVFVYGLNRSELCESIASVYGNIDTGVYVRRFFDMEFSLPAVDRREYCMFLAEQYGILTKAETAQLKDSEWLIEQVVDVLSTITGLSLRDIEQCTRIAAFVVVNMASSSELRFPYDAIMAVIIIRFMDIDLYRRFVKREHVAGQMIDFLAKHTTHSSWIAGIQAPLYAVCDEGRPGDTTALAELTRLAAGDDRTGSRLLATATLNLSVEMRDGVISTLSEWLSGRAHISGRHFFEGHWHARLVALLELISVT